MRKRLVLISVALCTISSSGLYSQSNDIYDTLSSSPKQTDYIKGELLIKFIDDSRQQEGIARERNYLLDHYQAKVKRKWKTSAEHWILDTLLQDYNFQIILDSLKKNPIVKYAEPYSFTCSYMYC